MYGIAVADLNLAPSEVRQMTPSEVYCILWAKTRHDKRAEEDQERNEFFANLKEELWGNEQ